VVQRFRDELFTMMAEVSVGNSEDVSIDELALEPDMTREQLRSFGSRARRTLQIRPRAASLDFRFGRSPSCSWRPAEVAWGARPSFTWTVVLSAAGAEFVLPGMVSRCTTQRRRSRGVGVGFRLVAERSTVIPFDPTFALCGHSG
jgi:hypothetical protein